MLRDSEPAQNSQRPPCSTPRLSQVARWAGTCIKQHAKVEFPEGGASNLRATPRTHANTGRPQREPIATCGTAAAVVPEGRQRRLSKDGLRLRCGVAEETVGGATAIDAIAFSVPERSPAPDSPLTAPAPAPQANPAQAPKRPTPPFTCSSCCDRGGVISSESGCGCRCGPATCFCGRRRGCCCDLTACCCGAGCKPHVGTSAGGCCSSTG
mmetsp:Transcript_96960/g.260781  ORF Transcript_96960/g.260781 Transcript_96960/m.260781 type:complete len:211 (-) Transcript_96960:261-893(-)